MTARRTFSFSTMENSCTTESLHRHVATNFGVETLRMVRRLEKTARRLAESKNHLRFNLRCRQSKLIPKSLKQKPLEVGYRAEKLQHNYCMKILNLRIRRLNNQIQELKQELADIDQNLKSSTTEEAYQRICTFTQNAQRAQHEQTKEKHKDKFQKLLKQKQPQYTRVWRQKEESRSNQSDLNKKENWVKNLSDRELSQAEKNVLSKGLNFSVTPNFIPTVDYITATESAIKHNNLSETEAADLRLRVSAALNNAKPPPCNITAEEKKALAVLQKDESINILPADKGRCTVVLNAGDYEDKINNLLSDSNTYERLRRDPTSGFKKKVIDYLQKLEKDDVIDRQLYHRLYPRDAVPCIYGLPKIHKKDIPLRPIVSSIDSVTYNVAKHLKVILSPLVGDTEHHIENTQDFVDKIRNIRLDIGETMVSYDVTSLFTSVPTAAAVEVVKKRLLEDSTLSKRTKLTPDHICQLLEICLNTTYFQFRGRFYRQIHGCAMGSPVSPIVANLYMEETEKKALASFSGTKPSHWFRYVDDTWVKIKQQEVEPFSEHINSVDACIKFTREDAKENTLAFLDCKVIIGRDRQLQTEVFRKATHTDQYLMFDSNHPLQHKLGVIRTLQHRAEEVPTNAEGKKKEKQHVQRALSACGYPSWTFNKCQHLQKRKKQDRQTTEPRRRGVSLPYVAGVSEKFQRIFRQHKIPVYFKPVNTLRQRLVNPKDKIPNFKQSNLVYSINCKGEECKEQYIGETKQQLQKRLYQHRREGCGGPQSAVHLHLKASKHSFEDKEVKILAKESRWFERGVKEAIFVKKFNPSLNRNGGLRFGLSPVYNSLLKPKQRRHYYANESVQSQGQTNSEATS